MIDKYTAPRCKSPWTLVPCTLFHCTLNTTSQNINIIIITITITITIAKLLEGYQCVPMGLGDTKMNSNWNWKCCRHGNGFWNRNKFLRIELELPNGIASPQGTRGADCEVVLEQIPPETTEPCTRQQACDKLQQLCRVRGTEMEG